MIRRRENGSHYCDGKECGYQLQYLEAESGEGAEGMLRCLDCGDALYAATPEERPA